MSVLGFALVSHAAASAARANFVLLGEARIPWDATDKSGQTHMLGDSGVRADRLGSMGSGIDYHEKDGTLWMISDRGPLDGATDYQPRVQVFGLTIEPGTPSPVRLELRSTIILREDDGSGAGPFSGSAGAYDADVPTKNDRRLDPEGIQIDATGNLWTSEEYGPFIDQWSADGKHLRRIEPPAKFMVKKRGDAAMHELPPNNRSGRQSNRGFEGLALSADQKHIYAITQGVLLQDGALDAANERIGLHVRLVDFDLYRTETLEYVYVLDDAKHGLNEITPLGPGKDAGVFIVLEKDGKEGKKARCRKLYRVVLEGATDVSAIGSLPTDLKAGGVQPVRKTLLLDMLDPKFGLAGPDMPEKVEGVAFGPRLADGRRTLIITSDNDFRDGQDTRVWVFACEDKDLGISTP